MKYTLLAFLFGSLITGAAAQQVAPVLNLATGEIKLENNLQKFISDESLTSDSPYKLLQFYQTPAQSMKEEMESFGIEFFDYLPKSAYLVKIPNTLDRSLLQNKNIYSISPLFPELKINPQVHSGLEAGYYNSKNELLLNVRFFPVESYEQIVSELNPLGVKIESYDAQRNQVSFYANESVLAYLTSIDGVRMVDFVFQELIHEDNLGRALHRSSSINQTGPSNLKFDGSGVSVAVNDDGEVGPHIDFTGRTEQSDVAGDQTGDHGDMVAGILGGAGNLNPLYEGMAKGAYLWIRQYSGSLPNTVTLHQNDDVMIFSSSYGNGCNAGYTGLSSQVDEEIRQNPSLIQVFSAGNSGTSDCGYGAGNGWGNITGGHKQGKNVIATANMERDEGLANSSSRGPAMDGRIKPDITAHGNGQISTDPNNQYDVGSGTSAAAPGISGVLAQLYEGYKSFNGGVDPESALMKAVLLNGADDIGNVGPDFEFGWGRVNGKNALEMIENNQVFSDDITQFDTDNYSLTIPAGVAEVKIMLYWNDYEGNPVATTALVNDLDLEVDDGTIHLPWVLDPTPNASNLSAPATTGVDNLNNMEQVVISNPAAGTVNISVNGFDVPQGPQRYYVVYRFVYDDIEVIYPTNGEGLVPGETERIFWDAHSTSGNFELEFSEDGGAAWSSIASVPGNDRSYDWTVPNTVSGNCLVRVSRLGVSDESDAVFSIIDTPDNIDISQVCPGYIAITWDVVPDASDYVVYLLGTEYMDSIGTTSTNVFQVPANINIEHWISVAAIPNNNSNVKGRRAIAIYYDGSGVLNCSAPDDLAVHEILAPTATQACSYEDAVVEIEIANYGQSNQSGFLCSYEIDGQAVVTESYPGTLIPGQIASYTFSTPFNLPSTGMYPTKVWVEPVTDSNPANDTGYVTIDYGGTLISNFPIVEDFESFASCGTATDCELEICSLGNGWVNAINGSADDIDWRVDNGGTPSNDTGPNVDHTNNSTLGNYVYLEASGGCEQQEALLISPCIDLTNAASAELSYWYHMYGGDMGELHIDIYDGTGWQLDVIPAVLGDQGDDWFQEIVNLSAYSGSVIQIRFRGITGNGWQSDVSLDDINIDMEGLSVSEIPQNASIQVYPNPSNGDVVVSFDFDQHSCSQILVLDAVGKEVAAFGNIGIEGSLNLNLNNLSAGSYNLRFIVEDSVYNRRIVLK